MLQRLLRMRQLHDTSNERRARMTTDQSSETCWLDIKVEVWRIRGLHVEARGTVSL